MSALNNFINYIKEDLISVDIGKWQSYEPYNSEEQLSLQEENLIELPIYNFYGSIKFIYTKTIKQYEDYINRIKDNVNIESTEVAIENEVFYTSKIEGAKSSIVRIQQIHNGSPIDGSFSECMILGGFRATKILNLYSNRISKDILRRTWEILTDGCRDNEEIIGTVYRNGPIYISNSEFKSVDVEDIDNYMNLLIDFYNSDILDNHPFIKAIIIHYTFETIHPFCDGNGRLGRFLINNYLISRGIESAKAVSFSMEIDKKRQMYDVAFVDSENIKGDCTPFIEYLIERMANAYYNITLK